MGLPPTESDASGIVIDQRGLNCIIDETAFVAGVKQTTDDGLKGWISAGLINLFVPLHSE